MPAAQPDNRPTVAISLGDPAGIGPEIVVRALHARPNLAVRVYGDPRVLADTARRLNVPPPAGGRVQAVADMSAGVVIPGRPNIESARAQLACLEAATDAALKGDVAALCTAPISKDWMARAGFDFPGHTEYLAARAGTTEFAMMLAGPRLRVVLATRHVALREVPRVLALGDIAQAAVAAARALVSDFGIGRARVAVAGLNPHAGESGRFGDEENRLVVPAIQMARARLAAERIPAVVTGPHPPDAVFRQAFTGDFDVVVALYHDQGLIPLKLVHFDDAVNITLGLPFARTSPDHGTAYAIAGTGRANPGSFLAALDLAAQFADRAARLRVRVSNPTAIKVQKSGRSR